MIRYRFPFLIAAWVICLNLIPSQSYSLEISLLSSTQQDRGASSAILLAQAEGEEEKEEESQLTPLQPGEQGEEVRKLQKALQKLDYYDGEIDGDYSGKTKLAILKFQSREGLTADGIAGEGTIDRLNQILAEQEESGKKEKEAEQKQKQQDSSGLKGLLKFRFLLLGFGILALLGGLGGVGLMVFGLLRKSLRKNARSKKKDPEPEVPEEKSLSLNKPEPPEPQPDAPSQATESPASHNSLNGSTEPENASSLTPVAESLPRESSSHLAKLDAMEILIRDLREGSRGQRSKAIWDLAQKGDSRAIQPLVELLLESDSQQRSLILEALSQISTRTLKPVNRALALSLQDDNPEVRKNAIRDLTKVYDQVKQVTHLLQIAGEDSDPEVKETAQWAMEQINRLRILSSSEDREN